MHAHERGWDFQWDGLFNEEVPLSPLFGIDAPHLRWNNFAGEIDNSYTHLVNSGFGFERSYSHYGVFMPGSRGHGGHRSILLVPHWAILILTGSVFLGFHQTRLPFFPSITSGNFS